ncbi:flavin monoamine oxidase family protein [Plastoroseomonas hellenica]|uniref:flavin monoamine oxidase family protein n=1 Tax=Plastoroseomonas hellenica TaxID=2687306 RepID=UPI0020133469|nr:FAD-dependent oxidoreductase [Plastoroseomonas hellenica]MBR0647082.1 FAD-dependent oxidoreductase [Plastoroseomonas hellenica]
MSVDPDVVIVGAGAAGVAAARRLAESGLSALLLEAGQRVGGRAWTCDVAGLPLDLGCGWLHSADRNPWTGIAEASGFAIDRRPPAWRRQYRDLGFSRAEQAAAAAAFAAWSERLATAPPPSDVAADALEAGGEWNAYLQAMSGFISGAGLERISAADYLAYDAASTECNWRVTAGYGRLIAASLPPKIPLRLATRVEAIALDRAGVSIATPAGTIAARGAILTVSTAVLAGGAIRLPVALDAWRHAASCLPLGRDEKLFLEILGDSPFAPETQVLGDPRDARTGAHYIRPLGRPVIECFIGGEGARMLEEEGPAAGFARAIDQLAALFGSEVRRCLRPLVASHWSRMDHVGGAYSHALPGRAAARGDLARPFEDRLFFAGEATHRDDFSTAHGAYQSGIRAAEEALAALAPRRAE